MSDMVRQTGRALAVAILATTALTAAACGNQKPTTGTAVGAAAASAVTLTQKPTRHAQWGEPVAVDGYTITLAASVDVTDEYVDESSRTAVLTLTATIIAGSDPVDPRGIAIEAHDGNYAAAFIGKPGDVTIPAGGTHAGPVFIRPGIAQRHGLIVVTLTGATGVVEWRQESR